MNRIEGNRISTFFTQFKHPLLILSVLLALLFSAVAESTTDQVCINNGKEREICVPEQSGSSDHKLTEGMKINLINRETFSITSSAKQNVLHLEGALEIGVVSALEKSLIEFPGTTGIILESEGGNIYQARGLARIIQNRSLNTYAFKNCFSACTIAYLAGNKRYLGHNAKLGFHGYRLLSNHPRLQVNAENEQDKDLIFIRQQISDASFIENIFKISSPDLWQPSIKRLQQVGVAHEILIEN